MQAKSHGLYTFELHVVPTHVTMLIQNMPKRSITLEQNLTEAST